MPKYIILQQSLMKYTMFREDFEQAMAAHAETIEAIRRSAHGLHESVNQHYGNKLPYGYHLDLVAEAVRDFGHLVCARPDDVLPLFFGAYYHDSIEDARLTYNDVLKTARTEAGLTEEQAVMAAEIVYALTNDKGRTRAERAGEKYYQGIRTTPYAPFVKMADRVANIYYSSRVAADNNRRMQQVYRNEFPHFMEAITVNPLPDGRYRVPDEMVWKAQDDLNAH